MNFETYLSNLSKQIAEHGMVVFAGAGVSADDPSRVPGWFALNGMILDALKQRVTGYLGRDSAWLDQVCDGIISRRDTHRFPPEYQAQIMEEQCGESYFQALASLDLVQQNKSHSAIARLAHAGYLKAVVTTNFDCLIERALETEKIRYESFIDIDDFRRLGNSSPTIHTTRGGVPILKIHGSVKCPNSMIDTLQQRIVGRSNLLSELLIPWLSSHVVFYMGFSAGDLNHNPEYLGLRKSAKDCPGALFIRYPGSSIEPGAKALLEAYGQKSYSTEAYLNDVFRELLTALKQDLPGEPAIVDADPRKTITTRLENWTESLDPYEAINMMSALFNAGGEEEAAWQILHKSWKSRLSFDSKGEHYARYQYNYASHCLKSGETQYEETPQNFLRSQDTIPQSLAGFALWNLYRARPDHFWDLLMEAKTKALNHADPGLKSDLMLVFAQAAVIYRWKDSLQDVIEAGNHQREVGDIPRAIKLWAAAARLAAHSGKFEMVLELFDHCEWWANYLGDETSFAELYLAQGIAFFKKDLNSVGWNLQKAMPVLRNSHRWPLLIEALIESFRYYLAEGRPATEAMLLLNEANQRILDRYEIYYPHLGIAVAEYHISVKQWDRARRELLNCRPWAERTNNNWGISSIDNYLIFLDEATGGSRMKVD